MSRVFSQTIKGEPASKSNSRQMVRIGGVARLIKSKKALNYEKIFRQQCKVIHPLFDKDVEVEIAIYYSTRRPDLDESLILDLLQGRVYMNDRQVKRKIISWGLDRDNPRAEIKVRELPRR